MTDTISCDLAILGGGLAGGLIALALAKRRPELDVRVIEAGPVFGGNHIWSFFADDIDAADRWLTAPLVTFSWTGYEIAFPAHARQLDAIYYSIESDALDRVMRNMLPAQAQMTGVQIDSAGPDHVMLSDGRRIQARAVIDARGPADLSHLNLGWQKFMGQLLTLKEPHGRTRPVIMDATVEQIDGYRFVYCLPFSANQMFVEDTYYSDGPELNTQALAARISAYAAEKGWEVESVSRTETGVLPVSMGGDFEAYWRSGGVNMPKAGMRAGLFHPTTGYSLPDAVRLAVHIATLPAERMDAVHLHADLHDFAARRWKQTGFYQMIDKMLFRAAKPAERYRILERFYTLNPALIRRFYAGRSTTLDKMRILTGKPPVPIGRALAALGE